MPDEPDPPRKFYGFKDRDFKRDNAPASASPPTPTAKDLAMMSGERVPLKSAARSDDLPNSAKAKPGDPNDVYAVLQQNRESAQRHSLNEVQLRKIKSKRRRDFWTMLVGGNLLIVGAVLFTGVNVYSVILGLAGIVMLSLGLAWVMWQVMDKY